MLMLGPKKTEYDKSYNIVVKYLYECPICKRHLWRQKNNSQTCIQCFNKREPSPRSLKAVAKLCNVSYQDLWHWVHKDCRRLKDFYKEIFDK